MLMSTRSRRRLGTRHKGLRMLADDSRSYAEKILALFGTSIVAYWPMWEPSGLVSTDISGRNHPGIYNAVTLGAPGIGDGRTSASFDGSTSWNQIGSAGLAADFNPLELSLLAWGVNTAPQWADASKSRYLVSLFADGNNSIGIRHTAVAGQLQGEYIAGGTVSARAIATGSPLTPWSVMQTVSKSNDRGITYFNGVPVSTPRTGLGVWVGALNVGSAIGGGNIGGVSQWAGLGAHVMLLNREATAAEALAAATVP